MTNITQLITRTLELDEAATPGPLEVGKYRDSRKVDRFVATSADSPYVPGTWIAQSVFETDATLFAEYRTAAPLLAEECLRLEAELKRWRCSLKVGQRVRVVDKHGDVHCGVTIVNGMIRLDDTSYIGVNEVTELEMLNES